MVLYSWGMPLSEFHNKHCLTEYRVLQHLWVFAGFFFNAINLLFTPPNIFYKPESKLYGQLLLFSFGCKAKLSLSLVKCYFRWFIALQIFRCVIAEFAIQQGLGNLCVLARAIHLTRFSPSVTLFLCLWTTVTVITVAEHDTEIRASPLLKSENQPLFHFLEDHKDRKA